MLRQAAAAFLSALLFIPGSAEGAPPPPASLGQSSAEVGEVLAKLANMKGCTEKAARWTETHCPPPIDLSSCQSAGVACPVYGAIDLQACQLCAAITATDACMKTGVFPPNLQFYPLTSKEAAPGKAGCVLGGPDRDCKKWVPPGAKKLCEIFGDDDTQAFEDSYGVNAAQRAADDKTVEGMFSGGADAAFFKRQFSRLPPPHWRFVVALEQARRKIVAEKGSGNILRNTVEGVTGGLFCDQTKCYEREDAVAAMVKGHDDRAAWKRFEMSSNVKKISEHTAGCYSYPSTPPVELAVDAWANTFTDGKQWWRAHDRAAHDGITSLCGGKSYCGDCACLYASYWTMKAWKIGLDKRRKVFDLTCPDSGGGFAAAEAQYGGALREKFGFAAPATASNSNSRPLNASRQKAGPNESQQTLDLLEELPAE